MGWQTGSPSGLLVCLPVLSSFCSRKSRRWQNKDTIFEYHSVGTPTCLCKHEVGKPSQNAAQPCARVHDCVKNDLRVNGLWKGWGFWVGTWNVDSLTDRAGEVLEALWRAFKKQWKGSGWKFYGTKGKRCKLFWNGGEERSDGVGIFIAERW